MVTATVPFTPSAVTDRGGILFIILDLDRGLGLGHLWFMHLDLVVEPCSDRPGMFRVRLGLDGYLRTPRGTIRLFKTEPAARKAIASYVGRTKHARHLLQGHGS